MNALLGGFILVVDIVGIFILCVGLTKFLYRYVMFEGKRLRGLECALMMRDIRIEVGSYILLALEVMIISDIIHGSISHDIEDLYSLGLLVVMRTAISYFLGEELKELKKQDH